MGPRSDLTSLPLRLLLLATFCFLRSRRADCFSIAVRSDSLAGLMSVRGRWLNFDGTDDLAGIGTSPVKSRGGRSRGDWPHCVALDGAVLAGCSCQFETTCQSSLRNCLALQHHQPFYAAKEGALHRCQLMPWLIGCLTRHKLRACSDTSLW